MYDQTQSGSSFGSGGGRAATPSYGGSLDGSQADEASLSKKLRVRIAGTALFTVGLAALSYSMVDEKGGAATEDGKSNEHSDEKPVTKTTTSTVNPNVKDELPDYLGDPNIDRSGINGGGLVTPPPPPQPPTPGPEPVTPPSGHSHSHLGPPPHNLHDFSSCGSFSTAFAHARAELGGPGEIFIYKGKPYTTTYKHEVEEGGHVHVKEGLDVEIVIADTADGKVIAVDSDRDGVADKWFVETNESRYEIIDNDGDGKLDSYIQEDGEVIAFDAGDIYSNDTQVPPPTYDVVTMDGVEFLAYDNDSNGQFDKLIGEHGGKYLYYEDTDGDGNFDHAAIVSHDLTTIENNWEIKPMNLSNGHIEIPDDVENGITGPNTDDVEDVVNADTPITTNEDAYAIGDDPYRVDIEHEINSGDLNNHTDMSAFGQ